MKDIIYAFSLYQLVKNVMSLKIILVIDINNIAEDNTQQFRLFLNALEKHFGNKFKDYFSSISIRNFYKST